MARPINPPAPGPGEAGPGQFTFSPAAQPIRDFIAACDAVIEAEMARAHHLHRYNSMAAEAHEAWMRLHEEDKQTKLRLGALGLEAIRAGTLAGEAATTAELVRNVQAVVRDLHGWVDRWWTLHGDAYRAWRKRHWPPNPEGIVEHPGACTELPPDFIDKALPLLRPAEDALGPLMNRLKDIAVAVPFPGPAGKRSAARKTGRPRKGESGREQLVIGALNKHHRYQQGGTVQNYNPAKTAELAELASGAGVKVSPSAVSRFFQKKFPGRGHKGYVAACNRDARRHIGILLALWQGEAPELLADLQSEEYGRRRAED